jgi:hypothetical protein
VVSMSILVAVAGVVVCGFFVIAAKLIHEPRVDDSSSTAPTSRHSVGAGSATPTARSARPPEPHD